ncbi:uncharacterized protein FYW61_002190 [Anableps anableps]
MWPNQGPPPPPMGQQNPAFPPGYSAPYLTPPGPGVYPQAPPPAYPGYPGYPAGQYPACHYSAPVSPALIHHGPPGVMPHGPPGPHAYPMHPAGHLFHPRGVHLDQFLHCPKGFGHGPHKGHHHHDGFNPSAGIIAGGMAVGMGLLSHKANKKMRKKMKKAHKYHMHGYYKHGKWSSSSSSSDSD